MSIRSGRVSASRLSTAVLMAAVLAAPVMVASSPPSTDASTLEYATAVAEWGREATPAGQGGEGQIGSIADQTAGMERMDGFMPLYWDEAEGKLWMEIDTFDTEILHAAGIGAGLGSNDIGIDRGALGGSRVVHFERVGPKVFMVQPNYEFRASSTNEEEVRAVQDAFARSILWAFDVEAETDGRVLVDLEEFLLRDVNGYAGRLSPGTYRLETGRSHVYMPMTMNFPENTEMEVTLTFVRQAGGGGGRGFGGGAFEGVGSVAPTSEAATIRVHHSFVQLPGPGYTPREDDPRAGYGGISYQDYSAPLGTPMEQQYVRRHRLEKVDPTAEVSDAVEPIVYYLDPGTPEPIRTALLEGARWWDQAFEAAGYRNAFRVEMRPPDVSSHDVRYNVINWVHRSTRGWSTGGSITDPRTGEIMKGVVTLGSLRWRQDYMIAEGLLSPYTNGDETPPELAEWALARIRQLSAHEVGHTLGLSHNYYDSSQGRISVLDYPHPLVTLNEDGSLDHSEVYDVGIGEWDRVAIAYGYQHFPEGTDEDEALAIILNEAWDRDIRFMTNQDTDLNPKVDQWSNGTDAAVELDRMMEVRRVAMDRFGVTAIKNGRPMATIEEVLVPLYLHHRYQVTAAASILGGMHYIYALRGDGRSPTHEFASADEQTAALDALLATITPSALALPREVIESIPPRPSGLGGSRELFPRYTGSMFDAVTPAVVAADHVVSEMLDDDRAARLVQQEVLSPGLFGLDEVLDRLVDATFQASAADAYQTEIRRAVERVVADNMMQLAGGADMSQVRAVASMKLMDLRQRAEDQAGGAADDADRAHYTLLAADITRFLERPAEPYSQPGLPGAPPGAPIGDPALDWLGNAGRVGGAVDPFVGTSRRAAAEWLAGLEPWCSQLDWDWGWSR